MDALRALIEAQRQSAAAERPAKYICRRDLLREPEAEVAPVPAPPLPPPEPEQCKEDTAAGSKVNVPPEDELVRRLRARGLPVRHFGESDRARFTRLRLAEAADDDGAKGGLRNEYAKHLARTEAGLELEILRQKRRAAAAETEAEAVETEPREADAESSKNRIFKPEYDVTRLNSNLFEVDPDLCLMLTFVFLRRLLSDWEHELACRPASVKRSRNGKLDYTNYVQTKLNLKPFFKLIKHKAVESDVIEKVAEILACIRDREYMRAHTAYLQLAIGNAPWPIGVTMVGIHERSAREKIHSNQVAHVLNDETQRKWIQSIKRLMSFAQRRYPPADPTKLSG